MSDTASLQASAAEPSAEPPRPVPIQPVQAAERIEALDVVRGFALLGIFLMNIEWFNRATSTMGEGMPGGLTGLDWAASWFVAYFVQGKFWTIFALLFGMGFAVMLMRVERAGRDFLRVYLRRIGALAVFGAAHYLFLWDGDILFSYAVGALALLIVLHGRARYIVLAIAAFAGLGFAAEPFFAPAAGLAVAGLLALYLRREKPLAWRGFFSMPLFSFLLLLVGVGLTVAAPVMWWWPDAPAEARWPLALFGPLLLVTAWLSWKYHQPPAQRSLRLAVALYVFLSLAMTLGGAARHFSADPTAPPKGATEADVAAATLVVKAREAERKHKELEALFAGKDDKATKTAKEPKPTPAEKVAQARIERDKRLRERAEKIAEETKVMSTGSWLEGVRLRGLRFPEKAAGDAGFASVLVGMFLLGIAFVRSGVMARTGDHLALFRRLALWGLATGIGIGVITSFFVTSHVPGDRHDGWGIAQGLVTLGNLPACLGYVGLVVLMLHSSGPASGIRVLAPLGRMALTTYLMQTAICTLVFYGWGFGQWGLPRAQQLLFVFVVYALQIVFSHWWLSRFRYGPMEWLWRGFTYRELPPLRVGAPAARPATAA